MLNPEQVTDTDGGVASILEVTSIGTLHEVAQKANVLRRRQRLLQIDAARAEPFGLLHKPCELTSEPVRNIEQRMQMRTLLETPLADPDASVLYTTPPEPVSSLQPEMALPPNPIGLVKVEAMSPDDCQEGREGPKASRSLGERQGIHQLPQLLENQVLPAVLRWPTGLADIRASRILTPPTGVDNGAAAPKAKAPHYQLRRGRGRKPQARSRESRRDLDLRGSYGGLGGLDKGFGFETCSGAAQSEIVLCASRLNSSSALMDAAPAKIAPQLTRTARLRRSTH